MCIIIKCLVHITHSQKKKTGAASASAMSYINAADIPVLNDNVKELIC